jgi:hypothetical protein
MIRIHCADFPQADAIWRMLLHVPDAEFHPVAIYVDDHGLVATINRSAVPSADPAAHTHQPAAP